VGRVLSSGYQALPLVIFAFSGENFGEYDDAAEKFSSGNSPANAIGLHFSVASVVAGVVVVVVCFVVVVVLLGFRVVVLRGLRVVVVVVAIVVVVVVVVGLGVVVVVCAVVEVRRPKLGSVPNNLPKKFLDRDRSVVVGL